MPCCDLDRMERKLRRLERLQNMTNSFERVAKRMAPETTPPVAVQKSLELRQERNDLFAIKLKLSRNLSRKSETDTALLLARVQARKEARILLGSKLQPQPEQPQEQKPWTAVDGLRSILEDQKARAVVKRARLAGIRDSIAAAERGLVVPEKLRRSICTNKDDVSVITDPTYLSPASACFTPTFSPSHSCQEVALLEANDDISEFNEEQTIDFDDHHNTHNDNTDSYSAFEEESACEEKEDHKLEISSVTSVTSAAWTDVSSEDDESSQRSKSVADMKEKVKCLEEEKLDRARALSNYLVSYRSRSAALEMERELMEDAKQTAYSEMKTLLVEQNQEAEYLRVRLTSLQKKSRTRSTFGVLCFFMSLVVLVWSALVQNPTVMKPLTDTATWNGLCAPVEPGTVLTPESGMMEAPWWAPEGALKKPLFHMAGCGNRPRLAMEIKNGMLHVSEGDRVLFKKDSKKVYVEADTLQIVNRRGGHLEMGAPWAVIEAADTVPIVKNNRRGGHVEMAAPSAFDSMWSFASMWSFN